MLASVACARMCMKSYTGSRAPCVLTYIDYYYRYKVQLYRYPSSRITMPPRVPSALLLHTHGTRKSPPRPGAGVCTDCVSHAAQFKQLHRVAYTNGMRVVVCHASCMVDQKMHRLQ